MAHASDEAEVYTGAVGWGMPPCFQPGASVVHRSPPPGAGEMPCCGLTPLEVPQWHRITIHPALVTCGERLVS